MERDRLPFRLKERGGAAEAVDHVAAIDEQRRAGRDLSLVILQGVACSAGARERARRTVARPSPSPSAALAYIIGVFRLCATPTISSEEMPSR
jgi:hypothetical protein